MRPTPSVVPPLGLSFGNVGYYLTATDMCETHRTASTRLRAKAIKASFVAFIFIFESNHAQNEDF